jgi:acetyl-CoA carboxylase carboxyl transferase subunit alpha
MLENAVYSVLSPEGFATILWKDRSRASEACKVMKITADDLKAYGIVEEVIAEGPGGVQHNRSAVFGQLDIVLTHYLGRFEDMDGKELRERRYNRFRAFGTYADVRGKVQE